MSPSTRWRCTAGHVAKCGTVCPRPPAWRLEPLEGTHLWRNRKKDGFHGNTGLAGRRVSDAASPIYRESNHGKTGKGRPVLGTAHGGYGLAKSRWFRSNTMVVWGRFTVLSNHGSFPVWGPRNSARYWTGTPTLAASRFRKPKRLRSFGNYLSIQPQKTMWAT